MYYILANGFIALRLTSVDINKCIYYLIGLFCIFSILEEKGAVCNT